MGKLVIVGISDQQIAEPPDTLVTYALGSCVGICIYDIARRMGGLSHILLPEAFGTVNSDKDINKFADTAIAALVSSMEKRGCLRGRLTAKIAGGANMFSTFTGVSIGERNVEMVKRELQRLNIRILAQDTGADYGRTVEFDTTEGKVVIKTARKGYKVI